VFEPPPNVVDYRLAVLGLAQGLESSLRQHPSLVDGKMEVECIPLSRPSKHRPYTAGQGGVKVGKGSEEDGQR